MPNKTTKINSNENKNIVRAGYDKCAYLYSQSRSAVPTDVLKLITERLPPGSKILDIGCGSGIPITQYLAADYLLTGVDISSSMIELARKNVPAAEFICSDMVDIDFTENQFDAVVSFYTLFHIPGEEQKEFFSKAAGSLKPGGLFLFTSAFKDDGQGYTEDDFFGVKMYWCSFGPETYRKMAEEKGFIIEKEGIIGHGFSDPAAPEETHPFIFAVIGNALGASRY